MSTFATSSALGHVSIEGRLREMSMVRIKLIDTIKIAKIEVRRGGGPFMHGFPPSIREIYALLAT
jgi:hypothetical protein